MNIRQEPNVNKIEYRLSLYDFDGTVYKGDSLIDFWKYTVRKKPLGLVLIPYQLLFAGLYLLKLISAASLKRNLLIQILLFDNDALREHVKSFWKVHDFNINPWVKDILPKDKKNRLTTVCISASPSFILKPITESLGFDVLIATDFLVENDKQTNRLSTPNCKGEEKVSRLRKWAEDMGRTFAVEKVYSDSEVDAPLYGIARQGYWVKNGMLSKRQSRSVLPGEQNVPHL